jgi:hypothetical protein
MPNVGPFCFRNDLEDPVNGLHVIFTGAFGTLSRGEITVGPPARILATGNQITILLKGAKLAPGMPLCFTVWTESEPIIAQAAFWSLDDNVIGAAEALPSEEFSPAH